MARRIRKKREKNEITSQKKQKDQKHASWFFHLLFLFLFFSPMAGLHQTAEHVIVIA